MMELLTVQFYLNGHPVTLTTYPNRTLLEILREDLGLTGTKYGCGTGECGACTVVIDGIALNSCLIIAGQMEGKHVETVEGLEKDGKISALQEAFVRRHALQCGYCTPGMLMSAKALLDRKPHPSDEEIKAAISGNLCRCTGYRQIIDAIRDASENNPPTQTPID